MSNRFLSWRFLCAWLFLAAVAVQADEEIRRLFSRLDLERPELAEVKAKAAAGDEAAAVRALNGHFQKRLPRAAIKPKVINNVARDADEALQFRFRSRSSPKYFELHREFEWNRNPEGVPDQHWLSLLASLNVLEFLADMYIKTGDEKYAAGCQRVFDDWWKHCPPGSGSPSWSLATAMMRVAVLQRVFERMVQWPGWPQDAEARLLNSIFDHTEFMNSKRGPGNQDITNSEHLMRMAAAFPEFRNAAAWCSSGFARVQGRIFEDVLEDGAQKELCSGYHLNAINTYTNTLKQVRAIGQEVPPEFLKRLEKMYEWCLVMIRPDGTVPHNGDSVGSNVRDYLRQGAAMFKRPDMAYVASQGKEGIRPDRLDLALPAAGYYTLRSGWTNPDDLYVFMDISKQPVVSHQDYDALHIDLYAYGRDFFPDKGTFSYGGQYHRDAKATKNHTTIAIDGGNQGDVPAVCQAFGSAPALGFLDGSQAGYAGITHRRQVVLVRPAAGIAPYVLVIDRIAGTGRHAVDLYFHFPPGELSTAAGEAQTRFPKGANLRVAALLSDGLETKAVETEMHPAQGQTVRRSGVCFHRDGPLPVTLVTLLQPYPGATPPALVAQVQENGATVTVQIEQGGIKDVLSATGEPARVTLVRNGQKTEVP